MVLPHLSNIQRITVNLQHSRTFSYPERLKQLWMKCPLIQILHLQLDSFHLAFFVGCVETAPTVLNQLKELSLQLFRRAGSKPGTQNQKKNLSVVFDACRHTLTVLSLFSDAWPHILYPTLGKMPRLERFQWDVTRCRCWIGLGPSDCVNVLDFLRLHKDTLRHVALLGFPFGSTNGQWLSPSEGSNVLPKLTTLLLDCKSRMLCILFPIPTHVTPFADTLEVLYLDGNTMEVEVVTLLAMALHKPPNGARLKALRVPVQMPTVSLFTTLAVYLDNLQSLEVAYPDVELLGPVSRVCIPQLTFDDVLVLILSCRLRFASA
jgi:hypothetical protein